MSPLREGLKHATRALASRNYRLFFGGQGISLIGTWLTKTATGWLVYDLTGSAFDLGLVGFAGQFPTLLMAPFAGVMVDRWNRHRVLVWTQALSLVQSTLLAVVALTGIATVNHLLALSVFQALVHAFDMPARQSIVVDLIEDRRDLPNAIALNSSLVNGAKLLGPTVAGVLIALVGAGLCFLIDAASYLAVIGSLLAMRLPPTTRKAVRQHVLRELVDGFRYSVGFPPIRAVLLLLAVVSLAGMPYMVLMPAIAVQTFGGGPSTLGYLMSAVGAGALCGAFYLASRRSVIGLGRLIGLASCVFGVGLVAFAMSSTLWVSLVLLVFVGGGAMLQMAAGNTVVQTIVDDERRGRVMSFYAMAFFGSMPLGSLLAGSLSKTIGVQATVLLGGVVSVAAGSVFLLRLKSLQALVRPIYLERGVIQASDD